MEGPADRSVTTDPLLSIDIDTPVELQRPEAPPPLHFIPSEEWIDAFEAQCNPDLYKRLKRFAAHRARNVARAGAFVDDYYAWELVQDALSDTALGVLRWDPAMKTLEAHARDAIATRSYHHWRRARRFRHEPVDVLASDAPRTMMVEIEASLDARTDNSVADLATRVAEVIAELREIAAEDREVLLLLDALAAGATTRKHIMEMTGLSVTAYHNARSRLHRLAARISPDDAGTRERENAKGV